MTSLKEQKNIRVGLASGSTFLFLMWLVFAFYAYPEYNAIADKKEELQKIYQDYEKVKASGLGYWEVKSLYTKLNSKEYQNYVKGEYANFLNDEIWNSYNKEIVSSIDVKFYKTNFFSNQNDYYDFLNNLAEEVKEEKDKLDRNQTKEKIDKILPTYVENLKVDNNINNFISANEENAWDKAKELGYDDTKLINYLERVIYSFWLINTGELSLWDITPLFNKEKGKDVSVEDTKKMKSGLYYFDVDLELTWNKKWALNFIHFLENVWTLEFTNSWMKVYSDNELNKEKIIDLWSNVEENIYENPIVDILSVSFKDYIDTSVNKINYKKYKDVVAFVKNTQSNQDLSFSVSLRFFIKWAVSDKKLEYITKVSEKYEKELSNVSAITKKVNTSKFIKSNGKSIEYIRKLSNYKNYLTSIRKDLFKAKNEASWAANVDPVYLQFRDYDKQFTAISEDVANIEAVYNKTINKNNK